MRNDASRKLRFTFCYLDEEMGYTYTVDMERRHAGLVEVDRPTIWFLPGTRTRTSSSISRSRHDHVQELRIFTFCYLDEEMGR